MSLNSVYSSFNFFVKINAHWFISEVIRIFNYFEEVEIESEKGLGEQGWTRTR